MAIELKAAAAQEVSIYMPYYKEPNKRTALPYAISLYQQGSLEGERQIEGGASIPFVANWRISNLTSDLTLCRVMFEGNPEFSYEVMMENSEFVSYLIETVSGIRGKNVSDFPQAFYSKLFRIKIANFEGS